MNAERFKLFGAAYLDGLTAAVKANPEEYGYGPEGVPTVVARMLAAISAKGPGSVNLDGGGFRRACKALGIKHTRKAITAYLDGAP